MGLSEAPGFSPITAGPPGRSSSRVSVTISTSCRPASRSRPATASADRSSWVRSAESQAMPGIATRSVRVWRVVGKRASTASRTAETRAASCGAREVMSVMTASVDGGRAEGRASGRAGRAPPLDWRGVQARQDPRDRARPLDSRLLGRSRRGRRRGRGRAARPLAGQEGPDSAAPRPGGRAPSHPGPRGSQGGPQGRASGDGPGADAPARRAGDRGRARPPGARQGTAEALGP
ncbi:hypothetical protein MICRO116_330007 [Micrococcus sp. 116]|nr:hypothetical protein MICRO116_330007 [Micrococcus sp. 116]